MVTGHTNVICRSCVARPKSDFVGRRQRDSTHKKTPPITGGAGHRNGRLGNAPRGKGARLRARRTAGQSGGAVEPVLEDRIVGTNCQTHRNLNQAVVRVVGGDTQECRIVTGIQSRRIGRNGDIL